MNIKSTILFIVAAGVTASCSGDPYGNGIIFSTQQAQKRVDEKKARIANQKAELARQEAELAQKKVQRDELQKRLDKLIKANSHEDNAAEISRLQAEIDAVRRDIRALGGSR